MWKFALNLRQVVWQCKVLMASGSLWRYFKDVILSCRLVRVFWLSGKINIYVSIYEENHLRILFKFSVCFSTDESLNLSNSETTETSVTRLCFYLEHYNFIHVKRRISYYVNSTHSTLTFWHPTLNSLIKCQSNPNSGTTSRKKNLH